jgi:hypothetical protein
MGMRITITNTKANGRRMARELMRDGMSVESLRMAATNFQLNPDIYRNRHRVNGFVEEVYRVTCWSGFCTLARHEGDHHSDVTGYEWRQARGETYCPECHEYTMCDASNAHPQEYPYVNHDGETVWACCVSTIGPKCGHSAS